MNDELFWEIPHPLPYSVLCPNVPALFSSGSDVEVLLFIKDHRRIDDDIVSDAGSLITVFFELSLSGALSGDLIPPWESSIEDFDEEIRSDHICWTLKTCNIDESSLLLLAQSFLLTHNNFPIDKIVFNLPGKSCLHNELIVYEHADIAYPKAFTPVNFQLQNDSGASSTMEITIEFVKQLSDDEKENVDIELSSWFAAGEVGLYTIPTLSPMDCRFTYNEDIVIDKDTLEFSLSKFTAHQQALNGLINICSSLHQRVAKIRRLFIDS